MISISQLLTSPTAAQFRAQMVTSLVTLGIPADQWAAGGVFSTILTIVSITLAGLASALATTINGFFLPTATGNGLVLLAFYMYGVTAPTATFASGSVTFTNVSGASYNKAAGTVTVLDADSGITYVTTQTLVLTGPSVATVTVQATTIGSVGSAAPGEIDTMVTSLIGVTCTNAAAVVGLDAPSDASVRILCLNSLGARSVRGPRTAFGYAIQIATNTVTGQLVNINRWSISSSSHTGVVTVYVASPSGTPIATDIAGVVASIEANARPDAVTVNVFGATTLNDTDALTVWCTAPTGSSAAAIQTAVENSIASYLASFPIGGVTAADDKNNPFTGLFASGVYGAVAAGVASAGATLVSVQGATDYALTAAQVVVDALAAPTVRLLPPAGSS